MIEFSASTISEVIQHVYTAATFTSVVSNLIFNSPFNKHQIDDIKQDLIIYLIAQESKVIKLFNRGQLIWFYIAIAKKQIHSDKSKCFGRYVNHRQEKNQEQFIDEMHESEYDQEFDFIDKEHLSAGIEEMLQHINQHINCNQEVKVQLELIKLHYLHGMTYRQISKQHDICISRISQHIQKGRTFLKNKMKIDLFID